MIDRIHRQPMALASPAGIVQPVSVSPGSRARYSVLKPTMIVACLALGTAALGACSQPVNCAAAAYRNGCVAGPEAPAAVAPIPPPAAATASPVTVTPNPGPAGAAPATVGRGEPGDFADMDDKQCRSYGLAFGSRDYADCRIRLSAQHRGVDPNIGTTSPGSGSR